MSSSQVTHSAFLMVKLGQPALRCLLPEHIPAGGQVLQAPSSLGSLQLLLGFWDFPENKSY